jgi:hypothetical protein
MFLEFILHKYKNSINVNPYKVNCQSYKIRNINPIPIRFNFQLSLRDRLNFRELFYLKNPCVFGDDYKKISFIVTYASIITPSIS